MPEDAARPDPLLRCRLIASGPGHVIGHTHTHTATVHLTISSSQHSPLRSHLSSFACASSRLGFFPPSRTATTTTTKGRRCPCIYPIHTYTHKYIRMYARDADSRTHTYTYETRHTHQSASHRETQTHHDSDESAQPTKKPSAAVLASMLQSKKRPVPGGSRRSD